VPIVPVQKAYAEVSISSEVINGMFSEMFLVKEEGSVFSPNEKMILLGFHTKGEGRLSIASVIADWADGIVSDKCTAPTHGWSEEQKVLVVLSPQSDELAKKLYWWDLAYHGMCSFCWQRRISTSGTIEAVSAQSQGLDPKDFPGSSVSGSSNSNWVQVTPPSTATTSRTDSTLQALRERLRGT
jgi:hypothetical protein